MQEYYYKVVYVRCNYALEYKSRKTVSSLKSPLHVAGHAGSEEFWTGI